jgi:hypothetical protein
VLAHVGIRILDEIVHETNYQFYYVFIRDGAKGATTFSIMTLSITTFSIMTFGITTFSITTFSIMTFSITKFSITTCSITINTW